eukprot:4374469-Lingulodinium_polyedra.AAC.1
MRVLGGPPMPTLRLSARVGHRSPLMLATTRRPEMRASATARAQVGSCQRRNASISHSCPILSK